MGWVWGHGDDLTESETIHMTKSVEVSSPRHSCSSHLSSQDLGGASAGCPCCCSHFLLHDSRCISKAHSDPLLTYRKKNVAFNSCEHCCVTLIQNGKMERNSIVSNLLYWRGESNLQTKAEHKAFIEYFMWWTKAGKGMKRLTFYHEAWTKPLKIYEIFQY